MPQGGAPFPGMPAYPQGYGSGMPLQAPSGGTAITAGVLGILGAVWAIIAALANVDAISSASGLSIAWVIDMQIVAFVIELLTLGPGSIMLLMRRMAGRWLVGFGAAVHILQGIIAVIAFLNLNAVAAQSGVSTGAFVGGGVLGALIVLAPAIATLVLVLLPLTGRWCAWHTQRVATAY